MKQKFPAGWPCKLAHPAGGDEVTLRSTAELIEYAVDLFVSTCPILTKGNGKVAFVPVPSSEATLANLARTNVKTRWGARDVCTALQARNLGTMRPCVVFSQPVDPTHTAERRMPSSELVPLLQLVEDELPEEEELVVYVDDVVSTGAHIAAVDYVLTSVWGEAPAEAIVVGYDEPYVGYPTAEDCYDIREVTLFYDSSRPRWTGRSSPEWSSEEDLNPFDF